MIYVFLFLLSFLLTYLIKNQALKFFLMDEPNTRSSHTIATPHGGGIAIGITWFLGVGYLYMYGLIKQDFFYALLLGIVISLIGLLDDVFKISPKIRIFIHIIIAITALFFLGGLNKIDLYFLTIENQIITNIFAILLVVWFINLYNFLDGIDGYAGSEAVFLGIVGFLLFGNSIFLILIVSVLGFLCWNWNKAKIFMGDVGSTLLGYNIAIFTLYYQNSDTSLLVWIILFALFWFDATFTLFKRFSNGEKLSQAHKKHLYQRLTQSGWSHKKVVVNSIFINFILFLLAAISFYFPSLSLLMLLVAIIFLYVISIFIQKRKKFA